VNVVCHAVGVVDSATPGRGGGRPRPRADEEGLRRYVDLAPGWGSPPTTGCRCDRGGEREREAGAELAKEYERAIFFAGKLIFERERWWDRLLHTRRRIRSSDGCIRRSTDGDPAGAVLE